jgi:hypothetical protein
MYDTLVITLPSSLMKYTGVTAAHVIVTETKKSRRYRLNDEAQVSLFFLMCVCFMQYLFFLFKEN